MQVRPQCLPFGPALQTEGDRFQDTYAVPRTKVGLRGAVVEFFKQYGKAFRNCVWEIFSKDRNGNSNITAQVMKKPGSDVFPYDNVEIVLGMYAGGSQNEVTGKISLRSEYRSHNLIDGTVVSAKEQFFRTLGHE